jgi:hypothetical protein
VIFYDDEYVGAVTGFRLIMPKATIEVVCYTSGVVRWPWTGTVLLASQYCRVVCPD